MLMLSKTKTDDVERKIISCLRRSNGGCSITEIVKKTKISRSAVRIVLAKLDGAGKVFLKNVGIAKVYFARNRENEI